MLLEGGPLAQARLVGGVLGDELLAVEDPDLVEALPDLHLAVDEGRGHRVAVGVQQNVALAVHAPVVALPDLGDVQRQGTEQGLLGREQLDGSGPQVPLEPVVALLAPGQ